MSLDRLIRLAQRTGDRLIVHDAANGRDVVILDIDAYEKLVLGETEAAWGESSLQRDDEEMADWHSAESILSDRYPVWDDAASASDAPLANGDSAHGTWEEGKEAMHDALQDQNETASVPAEAQANEQPPTDEPVFYEEPL